MSHILLTGRPNPQAVSGADRWIPLAANRYAAFFDLLVICQGGIVARPLAELTTPQGVGPIMRIPELRAIPVSCR